MKNKKYLLSVACILNLIYIISMTVYSFVSIKNNDELIANIFFLIIGIVFTVALFIDTKYEKNNKALIIISGIYFFIQSVIPGIICFIYLSNNSKKKKEELPIIKEIKSDRKSMLKAILLIFIFLFVTFLIPYIKFLNKINSIYLYIFLFIITIIICFNDLKEQFLIFIKNKKVYIKFVLKRYLLMLLFTFIVAIPIVLINNGTTSVNQQSINDMFLKLPFVTVILTSIYAPLVEESVFRLSLSKLINNKTLFIIISGLLFGTLHVIDDFNNIKDLLYILQYSTLGICLAKAYKDSNNIFVSISIHFIQNSLACLVMILTTLI